MLFLALLNLNQLRFSYVILVVWSLAIRGYIPFLNCAKLIYSSNAILRTLSNVFVVSSNFLCNLCMEFDVAFDTSYAAITSKIWTDFGELCKACYCVLAFSFQFCTVCCFYIQWCFCCLSVCLCVLIDLANKLHIVKVSGCHILCTVRFCLT